MISKIILSLNKLYSYTFVKSFCRLFLSIKLEAIFIIFLTFVSNKEYWEFLLVKTNDLLKSLQGFYHDNIYYNILTLFLIFVLIRIFSLLFLNINIKNSWINNVKYNQFQHVQEYASDILGRIDDVTSDKELDNLKQDFLNDLYNIYCHRSKDVQITWLVPNGNKLKLNLVNDNSKDLLKNNEYYNFKKNEGVVGKSYSGGELEFFDNNNLDSNYRTRSKCMNKTYLCIPIDGANSDFGVIGVGSDSGFIVSDIDKDGLKIMVRALESLLKHYERQKNNRG